MASIALVLINSYTLNLDKKTKIPKSHNEFPKVIQRFRAAVTLGLETQSFLPWKTALSYLLTKQINTQGAALQ